jgi:EthD domain-containing protein
MVLLKRRPDITLEQFMDQYENQHVPLGKKFIGHLIAGFSQQYPGAMTDFAADH